MKVSTEIDNRIPRGLQEALSRPDGSQWREAVISELSSIDDHGTLLEMPLPPDRKAIPSSLVFDTKLNAEGEIARHKARMVVMGCAQLEGVDYHATFAPVLAFTTMRCHLALVCHLDLELEAMDVKTAFLNATLKEEMYITLPKGIVFKNGRLRIGAADGQHGKQVFRLVKSLYGIKQAPRDWNEELNSKITSLGYVRCKADTCMYVKRTRTGRLILLPVFVDDMWPAFASADRAEWEEDKRKLMGFYDMKDLGAASLVLGMRVTRDRRAGTLKLDQGVYTSRVLESFFMADCVPVETPEEEGIKHSSLIRSVDVASGKQVKPSPSTIQAATAEHGVEVGELLRLRYASVIGSLMYAAISTRPDIAHAVNTLAQFVSAPLPSHWQAAMRILRYLRGTTNHGLLFSVGSNTGSAGASPISIGLCYSDSNWAGDLDDRKSRAGVVCKINGSTVSWMSKKQTTIALSSAEAEYLAAGEAVKEILWLRQLMAEMGYPQTTGSVLMMDNQAAIALANHDVYHNRSKHIDTRHHFIRDHVQSGAVDIRWVSTHQQEADILTKALGKHPFHTLRDRVLGIASASTSSAKADQQASGSSTSQAGLQATRTGGTRDVERNVSQSQ